MPRRRRTPWHWIFVGVLVAAAPSTSWAAPRDDLKNAYIDAAEELNNLEIEAALATLDAAVAKAAKNGLRRDPSLAPVHAMRAGLIYSLAADEALTLEALEQAVRLDYYVRIPIELRSTELQELTDQARKSLGGVPTDPVRHKPPVAAVGEDIEFSATYNGVLPDQGTIVLYWRPQGSEGEYRADYMEVFRPGNTGTATLGSAAHGDANLEYFIYVFDGSQRALANRGDKDNPLLLSVLADAAVVAGNSGGSANGDGTDVAKGTKGKRPTGKGGTNLPRFFLYIGVGTGVGIARGTAEQTYEQYTPGTPASLYGLTEQACAIERWRAGGSRVAPDESAFSEGLAQISQANSDILPGAIADLAAAYDPVKCGRHHPVSPGVASAPFHIAPEFAVRVTKRIQVSLFSRLQVVTGSRVYAVDPSKDIGSSFANDVFVANPAGVRTRTPFSWSIGLKLRYFFLPDDRKLRLFAGGFAGYGTARLRVPMGFSNDRNGNSVPDAVEAALHGQIGPDGLVIQETCVPVWPYNNGCAAPEDPNGEQGDFERELANSVRGNTPSSDQRIDTVRIGPGFVGALFGIHYQVVRNFAVFAELDMGGYFPAASSLLFDLTLGPVITF